MKQPNFHIIFGLGNPESKYENTYHNAGLTLLRYLMGGAGATKNRLKLHHHKRFRYVRNGNLVLAEPAVFMNESGLAVKDALNFFKAPVENLTVIHDDSDIALGNYKISFGRGAAGHRGVSSIISALKTKSFRRIRIGIRDRLEKKRKPAGAFVLGAIRREDQEVLQSVLREVMEKLIGKTKPSGAGLTSISEKLTSLN